LEFCAKDIGPDESSAANPADKVRRILTIILRSIGGLVLERDSTRSESALHQFDIERVVAPIWLGEPA
jgi:hypothetical protein